MSLLNRLPHRLAQYVAVRHDPTVRRLYYEYAGQRIYVTDRAHYMPPSRIDWLCRNIYFAKYRPRAGDTVVDFGAGYGEEAVWLYRQVPNMLLRYLGVEVQPAVFECLALTMHRLPYAAMASPWAVSSQPWLPLKMGAHYIGAGHRRDGQIRLPTVRWQDFRAQYDLEKIDLLKINIEGGELALLQHIGDGLCQVKRIIVSCHDFLGPETATKDTVFTLLLAQGYSVQTFNTGIDWADDWLFAERA
jgi:FkbM family methyltransferase